MKPVTEKVLQRFGYEHLLMIAGLRPRRLRVTLPEIMEAAKEEPRILGVLPAILRYNPKIIYRLKQDLPRYPELKKLDSASESAEAYRRYLQSKKETQKSLTMNLRLAPQEVQMLRDVSNYLQIDNLSETIRVLLREKAIELNVGKF